MIVVPEQLKDKKDIEVLAQKFNSFIYSNDAVEGPDHNYLKAMVPAVTKYEPQKYYGPHRQPSHSSNTIKMVVERLPTLKKNLNYRSSIEKWKTFYRFPTSNFISEYIVNNDLPSYTKVANKNDDSITCLSNELIQIALKNNDPNSVDVQYLMGTTGVGKTTFLKYFTKTSKKLFFGNKVIVSRVKYRDLENSVSPLFKKQKNETTDRHSPVEDFFEKYVINCIFRDCIADLTSYYWNQKKSQDNEELHDIETTVYRYIEKVFEESDTELEEAIHLLITSDEMVLNKFDTVEKIELINLMHNAGFKFCLILDGFDAISPEDIQLVDSVKDKLFIELLRKSMTNSFLTHQCDSGVCLRNLFLVLLIAARPATLAELNRSIQVDTDMAYRSATQRWLVVGCEMEQIVESRFISYFPNIVRGRHEFEIYWKIISYVLTRIRKVYPSIEHGKFIDLFNHNTREKIAFLCDIIEYMVAKMEERFSSDHQMKLSTKHGNNNLDELILDETLIASYLRNNSIECPRHELDYLLVLNTFGIFENHFFRDAEQQYVLNPRKGTIDNLFNYSRQISGKSWTYSSDPLLLKYYVLKFIEKEGPTTIDLLKQWVGESGRFELTNQEISFLIRSGMITVEFSDMATYLKVTRRGVFVTSELLYSNVYFEHSLLRSLVPKFIADTIEAPTVKGDSRIWGLVSVFNMIRFLKYIRLVETSHRSFSNCIFNTLPPLYPLLEQNVGNAILSIVNEGLDSGSHTYSPRLQSMVQELVDEIEA